MFEQLLNSLHDVLVCSSHICTFNSLRFGKEAMFVQSVHNLPEVLDIKPIFSSSLMKDSAKLSQSFFSSNASMILLHLLSDHDIDFVHPFELFTR